MTDTSDYRHHPVYREIVRIFGDPEVGEGQKFFLLLPLVDEDDLLGFLRGVPAGTAWEALAGLAAAYRAEHPIVVDDPNSPGHV